MPAKQLEQPEAATAELAYWPEGQLVQVDEPEADAKVPAAQFEHEVEFALAENLPLSQLVQAVAFWFAPNVPALQSEHLEDPAFCWNLPAAQGVHEVTACPAENVPAEQEVHTPVFTGLNSPALQSLFEQVLAAITSENRPMPHLVQVLAEPAE